MVTLVISGLLFVAYRYQVKQRTISETGLTTVARVAGFDGGRTTSGPSICYIYKVKGGTYNGSASIDRPSDHPFPYYHVSYARDRPDWSNIHLNRPVSDSLIIIAAGFRIKEGRN